MKILVTAGATRTPIDKVRAITNVFGGKTGTNIAKHFAKDRENEVTLVTSNPGLITRTWNYLCLEKVIPETIFMKMIPWCRVVKVVAYKTFDDLARVMEREITTDDYDLIIHSAAVSDYKTTAVCVMNNSGKLVEIDSSGKISSKNKEMYLKLEPTYKIIDKIRDEWKFKGKLVKFKLQVDMSDEELIDVAKKSRTDSGAEVIIANCLEWAHQYAYAIDGQSVEKIGRDEIAQAIERRL